MAFIRAWTAHSIQTISPMQGSSRMYSVFKKSFDKQVDVV